MKPSVGMEVTASIRLTRPLGSGGMGSVWVARHEALDTDVAVKFLSTDLVGLDGTAERFANEAIAASRIKSPHTVHVYDVGVTRGQLPYIVMELLDGEDLGARVERTGPLELSFVTAIVHQVARALAKTHQVGIVHRDVKPENLLLLNESGEPFVKLIDFGIAKRAGGSSVTVTGTIVGTPDFMCPEQLVSAKDVGPSADMWGLVAVAYYALTARRPFPGETLPAVILAIDKGEFALPFARYRVGTEALDRFFLRALHADPARRFSTWDALVEAWNEAALVSSSAGARTWIHGGSSAPPPARAVEPSASPSPSETLISAESGHEIATVDALPGRAARARLPRRRAELDDPEPTNVAEGTRARTPSSSNEARSGTLEPTVHPARSNAETVGAIPRHRLPSVPEARTPSEGSSRSFRWFVGFGATAILVAGLWFAARPAPHDASRAVGAPADSPGAAAPSAAVPSAATTPTPAAGTRADEATATARSAVPSTAVPSTAVPSTAPSTAASSATAPASPRAPSPPKSKSITSERRAKETSTPPPASTLIDRGF